VDGTYTIPNKWFNLFFEEMIAKAANDLGNNFSKLLKAARVRKKIFFYGQSFFSKKNIFFHRKHSNCNMRILMHGSTNKRPVMKITKPDCLPGLKDCNWNLWKSTDINPSPSTKKRPRFFLKKYFFDQKVFFIFFKKIGRLS